jgi:hypothetical protein
MFINTTMDVTVRNLKEVTFNRCSHARILFLDRERFDFLESYNTENIITTNDIAEEYLSCYQEGIVELLEEMIKYFDDLIHAKSWFSHRIRFEGRKIFTAIEDEPFEEIFNPESKKAYRQAKSVLTKHLQYCLESNEVPLRVL